jgi:4-amino-4-deoxy-L-arabinose transferase-like glycosyltransferase
MATAEVPRRWAWPALAIVLAGGLALRLWGVQQGLPYAFNADEADHFVPRAVHMFGHSLNPHYFANPPGFTYVLHYLFALAYGGTTGVRHAFALHPADLYMLARIAAAVLGVCALWLLYAIGARLFSRAVGLLAAAIGAVAFLPVFYAHLALNDAPTLAPLTLSLLGTAGVLRKGRKRDYLLAGLGLGLACATKYTAGIVIVPFAAAVAARYLDGAAQQGGDREGTGRSAIDRSGSARQALVGIAVCAAAALVAFFVANPYSLLDYQRFHSELVHQSTLSAESQGKLGAPRQGGLPYYLWSLTWGLGWLPAIAALGGALTIWRRAPSLGWLLVPAPLLFLAFMSLQGRHFGRWLLPVFPLLCLLAAVFVLQGADALARLADRRRSRRDATTARAESGEARRRPPRLALALALAPVAAVLAQGLLFSVHSGLVLSRADTRNLTRAWMVGNVPVGAMIVAEPVSPDEWAREVRPGTSTAANPYRWHKYSSLRSRISSSGALLQGGGHVVGIEEYERTLSPALLGYYEQHGYCFLVSGSTESGRAFADPRAVPQAVAYYRALQRQGEVVFRSSPYGRGQGPVAFGFDWSFDYYPLAYHRPGPSMTIYRLHGGRCGR